MAKAAKGASPSKPKVGFIGVGLMGHGMAKNILLKGYDLTVMGHRNRKPVEDLLKRGAKEVKTPATMAKKVDILFLCVTSSLQIEDLMRRRGGILDGAHKGLVVVDASTADPNSTLELAAELKAKGARMIDAPLGRSPREAEEGRLNAFVGGDAKTLKEVRPVIEAWAENIVHVGPLGSGHKVKLINNMVAMTYAALYAETFTACKKVGVDPAKFRAVIETGGLNNGFFQNVCKWVLGRDPKAHEFAIRNCLKDVTYYNNMADAAGMSAVVAGAVKQSYRLAVNRGYGEHHMPMMSEVLAELNGVSFESEGKPAAKKKGRKR